MSQFTHLCLLLSSRSAAVATLCRVSLDATTRWTTVSTSGTCFASMNFTIPSLHCWHQMHNERLVSWWKIQQCITYQIYTYHYIKPSVIQRTYTQTNLHNWQQYTVATAQPPASITVPARAAQHSTGLPQSLSWLHKHSSLGEAGGDPGLLQPLSHLQNLPGRRREKDESGIRSAQT